MISLLETIRAEFERLQPSGISAPVIQRVARDVYREVKPWPVAERDRLCSELFASGRFEQAALVCYVYRRFAKHCRAREFRMFTRWLDRHVDNWGLTDALGLWLLGASIANDASLIGKLDAWTG